MDVLDKIVKEVERLVQESPDNKYQKLADDGITPLDCCYYNIGKCANGSKGCLIGQALINLNLANKYDLMFYTRWIEIDSMTSTSLLLKLFQVDIYNAKVQFLQRIQIFQDRGHTWQDAWDNAINNRLS